MEHINGSLDGLKIGEGEGGGRGGGPEVDLAVYKVDKVLDTVKRQELMGNDKTDARSAFLSACSQCLVLDCRILNGWQIELIGR